MRRVAPRACGGCGRMQRADTTSLPPKRTIQDPRKPLCGLFASDCCPRKPLCGLFASDLDPRKPLCGRSASDFYLRNALCGLAASDLDLCVRCADCLQATCGRATAWRVRLHVTWGRSSRCASWLQAKAHFGGSRRGSGSGPARLRTPNEIYCGPRLLHRRSSRTCVRSGPPLCNQGSSGRFR